MSSVFLCGTHSEETHKIKDMREKEDILVWNEEYTTHVKFPYDIHDMLCEIRNKIESEERENGKNKGKRREMKSNVNCSVKGKCKTSRVEKCTRRKSYNKRSNRLKMRNRNNENIMICIVNSE